MEWGSSGYGCLFNGVMFACCADCSLLIGCKSIISAKELRSQRKHDDDDESDDGMMKQLG